VFLLFVVVAVWKQVTSGAWANNNNNNNNNSVAVVVVVVVVVVHDLLAGSR